MLVKCRDCDKTEDFPDSDCVVNLITAKSKFGWFKYDPVTKTASGWMRYYSKDKNEFIWACSKCFNKRLQKHKDKMEALNVS
jgi:hypothetical protein